MGCAYGPTGHVRGREHNDRYAGLMHRASPAGTVDNRKAEDDRTGLGASGRTPLTIGPEPVHGGTGAESQAPTIGITTSGHIPSSRLAGWTTTAPASSLMALPYRDPKIASRHQPPAKPTEGEPTPPVALVTITCYARIHGSPHTHSI